MKDVAFEKINKDAVFLQSFIERYKISALTKRRKLLLKHVPLCSPEFKMAVRKDDFDNLKKIGFSKMFGMQLVAI